MTEDFVAMYRCPNVKYIRTITTDLALTMSRPLI